MELLETHLEGSRQPRGQPAEQDPADVGQDGELQVRRLLPGGVLPEKEPRRHRADDPEDQQAQEERRDRGKPKHPLIKHANLDEGVVYRVALLLAD